VDGAGRPATGDTAREAVAAAAASVSARQPADTDPSWERPMSGDRHAAETGDTIVISGHRVGEKERTGEIVEVLGEPGHERYRVRWNDGHESLVHPGSDATIRHSVRRRRPKKEEP
jgi:hypothetical protein